MNRFAKIMQAIGWLAAAVWLTTWIQGFRVEGATAALAWHTISSLTAAALTLLSRGWTLSYFLLAARERRRGAPAQGHSSGRTSAETSAILAELLFLGWLAVVFASSGQLLWHRIDASTHSMLGLATVALHVAVLLLERRALAREAVPAPVAAAL